MGRHQRKLIANSLYDLSVEQRLQVLIDCIDEYSIYLLDINGFVVTWNAGARRNKGYVADEILGVHYRIFFSADDRNAKIPEILLHRAARLGRAESEGWRIRKGGTRFWAAVNIFAVRNPAGQLLEFAKITQNRSEKLVQEALTRARDQAVVESEAKAALLARISHELRTPLNAICGYAEALQMLFADLPDAKKREFIDIISLSAKSLSDLVRDIWDRHANTAAAVVIRERVDLRALVAAVVQEFGPSAHARMFDSRVAEAVVVRGDPARITQILRNFVGNAHKYAGPNALIRIDARRCEGDRVELFVDDDGPGIPASQEKAVFGRYYRLDTQSPQQGVGFGLWFCRELALLMNGEIGSCRSPLGGARFWLRLPRGEDASP